jgi:hypothetical protein
MRFAAWVVVLAVGCDSGLGGSDKGDDTPGVDGDGADQADADADTDSDADTDADADADSDADADTGTPSDLDCYADYLAGTPAPGSSGLGSCVTQEIGCGDVIYATNTGGSTIYDYAYWEDQGSLGPYLGDTTAFDGPERVYVFRGLQEGQGVTFRVESCMDVWATWIRYGDVGGDFCSLDTFNQAGIWESSNGPRERWTDRINTYSPSGYDFELQIEGLFGAEGNYKITAECF